MHMPLLGIHSSLSSPHSRYSLVRNRPYREQRCPAVGVETPPSLSERACAGNSERGPFRLMRCVFGWVLRVGSSAGSQDGQETRHRGGGGMAAVTVGVTALPK